MKALLYAAILALILAPQGLDAAKAKSKAAKPARPAGPPLYEKIGGQKAVQAFTLKFLKKVLADPNLKEYFKGVDAGELGPKVEDFVCMALGGPCKYEGRGMRESHEGMMVTNASFDLFLQHAIFTLRDLGVGGPEVLAIAGALNGLRKDIVTLK